MFTIDRKGNAVFPDGIEQIKDCLDGKERKELKELIIPETVKRIEKYAFQYCENLENLALSSNLEFIGKYAFDRCRRLKSFTMPDSIKEIQKDAFRDVPLDESVYNADKSVLYVHRDTCRADTVVLPDTVKRIFSGAFTGKVFENIILNDTLEQIDSDAFLNCILCKKVTVNCSIDKIQDGAFRNFRPAPELIFLQGTPEYTEILRIFGRSPLERVEKLNVPVLTPMKRYKLDCLIKDCSKDDPDTMLRVAEFFSQSGKQEFYKAAANFWYYRAMLYGCEKAKKIICEKCNREKGLLPTVAWDEIGNESGKRLNALGFSFFAGNKNYNVSLPDENGIVKVRTVAESERPDEDGFGREECYDWWFLDENLREIPGIRGVLGYSNSDKRNSEKMFERRYDNAVRYLKARKAIRTKILLLLEEKENGVNKEDL